MKLTNRQVLEMASAIENLPPLKDAPKATYAMARNLARLKSLRQAVLDTKDKIFEDKFDLKPGQKYTDKYPLDLPRDIPQADAERLVQQHLRTHPKYEETDRAFQEVLKMDVDFETYEIDYTELKADLNPISPSHLELLLPLIKNGT